MPQPLVGMDLADLREALGPDQPAYRARQIYEALYRGQAPTSCRSPRCRAALRQDLAARHALGLPEIARVYESADGTRRYLLRLADGRTVETVLMPEGERDTICISSQVGCPVDCKFCMTALLGLERSLTAGEIVGQVLPVARDNRPAPGPRPPQYRHDGPGRAAAEPRERPQGHAPPARSRRLRAFAAPHHASRPPASCPRSPNWAASRCGPKLAISLNASTEEARQELMPITRKYHLKDLMEACQAYPLRPWEKLTFEYVLLNGVNDTDADARRVAKLLANLNCKVNLIALNPGPEIPYETPSPERVAAFSRSCAARCRASSASRAAWISSRPAGN